MSTRRGRPRGHISEVDTFGARLRRARLLCGLTQRALAERIKEFGSQFKVGTLHVWISRIERDEQAVHRGHLLRAVETVLCDRYRELRHEKLRLIDPPPEFTNAWHANAWHRKEYVDFKERPVTIFINRGGFLEHHRRGAVRVYERLLPVFSVETEYIATRLEATVASTKLGKRYVVNNWYSGNIDEIGEALKRLADRVADAYEHFKLEGLPESSQVDVTD